MLVEKDLERSVLTRLPPPSPHLTAAVSVSVCGGKVVKKRFFVVASWLAFLNLSLAMPNCAADAAAGYDDDFAVSLVPADFFTQALGVGQFSADGVKLPGNVTDLCSLQAVSRPGSARCVASAGAHCGSAALWGGPRQGLLPSIEAAAALAVTAGLDQDLNTMVGTPFLTLVNQSKTPALSAAIDRAAGNVLRLKFAAGLFDRPHANTSRWGARDSPAARELAREAAEQSVVLLINRPVDGQKALPLDRAAVKRIAVIGPNGDQMDNTLGDCERSHGQPQPSCHV